MCYVTAKIAVDFAVSRCWFLIKTIVLCIGSCFSHFHDDTESNPAHGLCQFGHGSEFGALQFHCQQAEWLR